MRYEKLSEPGAKHPEQRVCSLRNRTRAAPRLPAYMEYLGFDGWGEAIADLVNNTIYLYGTVVFSSLTLISGRVAIQKLATFGIITVAAGMVAVFVLEVIDGED
jgi:hypothetical protein